VRPPPLLIRRIVIDPVWIPLAVLLAAVFAAVALVTVPFGRRRRIPRLALMAALYLLVDAGLIVACAALWGRQPIAARRSAGWADAHEQVLRRALALLMAAAWPLLGFRVRPEELPGRGSLPAGRPLLVLARHGGPGDSFAIAELLLSRYRRRPVIVLKESLRWDPGLDVLLSRMPSCFLPASGPGRDLPARVAELAAGLTGGDALLIFPEGGNWTPGRHIRALTRLRARGRPAEAARAAANRHVLPPHPGGVLASLAVRPDLEVLIAAHTGLDDLVSPALIWRALPVTARPMVVRWWYFPAAGRPADPQRLQGWLDLQWTIVDSWIDARKARQAGLPAGAGLPPPALPPAADAAAGSG
jgi:1-acyl-sn-glycerol-3-phosphate acyltransferase